MDNGILREVKSESEIFDSEVDSVKQEIDENCSTKLDDELEISIESDYQDCNSKKEDLGFYDGDNNTNNPNNEYDFRNNEDLLDNYDNSSELGNETEPNIFADKKIPYYKRYYLLYEDSEEKSNLDINGTMKFLQNIGFDGGELKRARDGESSSENMSKEESNKNQLYCSYCGCEITGVDFYSLPDGRSRCTSCSNSIIKSKSDIEEIYSRIKDNFEMFFNAFINVPVSIEVLEERKLKRRMGKSIGDLDDNSLLVLGVALNKKNDYRIVLENAAPRISVIATLAHELTHIWQFTHWTKKNGFKKIKNRNKHLIIYEGMAKWVEIQYLYLIGEKNVAKREEEYTIKRDDEYGIGFRIYSDKYPLTREAMSCGLTPFNTNNYPIGED